MVFAKNEIVCLKNGNKYIVVDMVDYNDDIYYKLRMVSNDEKQLLDKEIIVRAFLEDLTIYIDLCTGEVYKNVSELLNK